MIQRVVRDDEIVELYQLGITWRDFQTLYGVSTRRLREVLSQHSDIVVGRKNPDTRIDKTGDIVAQYRVMGLIIDVPDTGCIELHHRWDKDGYPLVNINKKQYRVSRLVLKQQGVDVAGKFACHTCHNPHCINPKHLYAGTAIQNSDDKKRAGREPVGVKHPRSKLTEENVREIRLHYAKGVCIASLARQYKAGENTISCIVKRKTWKHVV